MNILRVPVGLGECPGVLEAWCLGVPKQNIWVIDVLKLSGGSKVSGGFRDEGGTPLISPHLNHLHK